MKKATLFVCAALLAGTVSVTAHADAARSEEFPEAGITLNFTPEFEETKGVIVLMCALPCGSMNVIFAENYDVMPHFSARTVSLSMIFMLLTLVFWAWAVKMVF